MKCIYNYLSLLRDATLHFAKKYKVSKEESLSLSLKCLITCLRMDNKFVKNHFSAYYLTTLDRLFKETKEIPLLPYINVLNEVEVIIYYLNLKKFPKYLIGDILGLDGYYVANIIDGIDMKLMS